MTTGGMSVRTLLASSILCASIVLAGRARAEAPVLTYFVDVSVPSIDDARELAAAGFDIAGVNRKASTVGVVVTAEDLARLEAFGWPVTIRGNNADAHAVDALSDYTNPQELSAFMDAVVAAHPDLAKKILLKDPLFEGQKQYALQITKDVGLPNERPSFILDAQHHAREVMTPEIAKDMIDYLTSFYAISPQVKRWVDNINIYVVPSVNPDGAMYVFTTDVNWRKNRHPACGVDNNRNYPTSWGACNGSSGSCSSDTYRGGSAGSEPETQGLIQLTSDAHPYFALSYHSYGEYIMYSYGCNDPDERPALDEVAQSLNSILENDSGVTGQYATGPIWSTIYLADGGSVDTQYNQHGAYSYVIEVNNNGFQPDYATWRDITVMRQRTAWMFFLDNTLDGAQIRGTVTDAATGLPLPANLALQEVTFTHGEAQRHADAKGHYRLLVKSGATSHVTYSYPGYCSATQEVPVASGPVTVDVVLGQPGIPTGVAAAAAGDNAIDVSWQAAVNADQYRVLRSLSAGGPYTAVTSVPGSQLSLHDTPVSGGVTYYYVVRAVQGCESASSTEVQAATTGPCTVGPVFAGLASVTNPASSTCALNLSWLSAASRCGGNVVYDVHRSASTSFTPSPLSRVASGLSGTSFTDHDALASATPYTYIVRAIDASNGTDDGNLVGRTMAATGPNVVGTWTDNGGDTGSALMTMPSPWSVKPTGGRTGPMVYATGAYSNNVCAALMTPAITVQSGASLSFASKYDLETNYDAGVVEVAPGPSYSVWTKLPVAYPDGLSFGGNACGYPTSGAGTVFSRTNAVPTYPVSLYSASLASFAGQSVKVRWRLSSDGGVVGAGWWVDDVAITSAIVPGSCSPGASPAPKEPSADGGLRASHAPAGTGVDLTFTPACGALDDAVYWGYGPIAGAAAWTNVACGVGNTGHAVFDPGDPAPDTFLYFVVVGQRIAAEGSYGTGTSGERPEAAGFGACDSPQVLAGSCP